MAKKTKEELAEELVAQLNATLQYNDVEDAQDRRDEKHDAAIDVIKGQGFVGQDPDSDNSEFDDLVEFLTTEVEFVPATWRRRQPQAKP